MSEKYIIAHDMGTSGNKAVLLTVYGKILHAVKETYPLYHPEPGYAEQDPEEWWQAVCSTTQTVIKKTGINIEDVAGVTFASQVMSLIAVDEKGTPLTRSMSWLDVRAAEVLHRRLWTAPKVQGYNIIHLQKFLRLTGGAPGHTGKDQIAKLLWLQENEPKIFKSAYKFLDAKDYIIFKMTGNMVTSVDVAVIWWMLDTRNNRNQWDPELCSLAGITPDKLAEVKESAAIAGRLGKKSAAELGLTPGTPVINGASDLASAALGSGATKEGELHIRIGTSGRVAGHFTKRKLDLVHYTGCIGSTYPQKYYLGIAHQETAGLCLEWLKNKVLYHEEQLAEEHNVGQIYQVLDQLAVDAWPGAGGLIFTPWMFGERCPIDDANVRGGLFNVGLNHSREHIVRAVFEGIAFNTRWAMESLEKLYSKTDQLNIIGGGAKSDIWCQIMADITNRSINQVSEPQETTARGIALLASMTLGYIETFEEIGEYVKIKQKYTPDPANRKLYDNLFKEFKNIYKQNKKWYKRMNG